MLPLVGARPASPLEHFVLALGVVFDSFMEGKTMFHL